MMSGCWMNSAWRWELFFEEGKKKPTKESIESKAKELMQKIYDYEY